jgi:hypothetical protein
MIIINNYSRPIYILFDYDENIKNYVLDETFFDKNGYIFILTSWYKTDKAVSIANMNPLYNIVILANSIEEKTFFETRTKSDVIFCNHNAFLDENKFKILGNLPKFYNLVIDSAFHEYKNVEKAKKVENVLHIGYFKRSNKLTQNKVIPSYGKLANFVNGEYKLLNKVQINTFYNQSQIGGIFSESEGACFASSQYLLSGLPVISIKSSGGRDIWYNEYNSVICDNDEDSIYNACQLARNKLASGEFNREKIRELHIQKMDEHRNALIEYIKRCVLSEEIDVSLVKKMFAYF